MADLLIQSSASSVVTYLETTGGSAAEGLTASDVHVALKKYGETFFSTKTLTTSEPASADIGSGANGTVTLEVAGTAGNSYTVEVVLPGGTSPLVVDVTGTAVTVELAVNGGVAASAQNTAALIAAAIEAASTEITATASGDGSASISVAEGPTPLVGGTDGTFTHLGDGYYSLTLSATDTNTVGALYIRITGPSIRSTLISAYVYASVSASADPGPSVTTTSIFGWVRKPDGTPAVNASVSARPLSQPTLLHSGTEGMLVTYEDITTRTDSTGYFAFDLVRGASVDISIPAANYRRTFVVPSSTTNLFDIA